jgi:aminoglycoside phosphotransferase
MQTQLNSNDADECPLCKQYEGREPNAVTLAAIDELDRKRLDPNAQTYTVAELWAKLDAEVLADAHD